MAEDLEDKKTLPRVGQGCQGGGRDGAWETPSRPLDHCSQGLLGSRPCAMDLPSGSVNLMGDPGEGVCDLDDGVMGEGGQLGRICSSLGGTRGEISRLEEAGGTVWPDGRRS